MLTAVPATQKWTRICLREAGLARHSEQRQRVVRKSDCIFFWRVRIIPHMVFGIRIGNVRFCSLILFSKCASVDRNLRLETSTAKSQYLPAYLPEFGSWINPNFSFLCTLVVAYFFPRPVWCFLLFDSL